MNIKMKRWIRPALFTAGGILAGLAYYYFFGCRTGCAITSSPTNSMIYMGIMGWLISGIFGKQGSLTGYSEGRNGR